MAEQERLYRRHSNLLKVELQPVLRFPPLRVFPWPRRDYFVKPGPDFKVFKITWFLQSASFCGSERLRHHARRQSFFNCEGASEKENNRRRIPSSNFTLRRKGFWCKPPVRPARARQLKYHCLTKPRRAGQFFCQIWGVSNPHIANIFPPFSK